MTENNGGISFIGLLQLVFILLKLLDKISWKWIWVLSPLWISVVLAIILFIVFINQAPKVLGKIIGDEVE